MYNGVSCGAPACRNSDRRRVVPFGSSYLAEVGIDHGDFSYNAADAHDMNIVPHELAPLQAALFVYMASLVMGEA